RLRHRPAVRAGTAPVRRVTGQLPDHPAAAGFDAGGPDRDAAVLPADRPPGRGRPAEPHRGRAGQDAQHPQGPRDRRRGARHAGRQRHPARLPGHAAHGGPGGDPHLRGHRDHADAHRRPGHHRHRGVHVGGERLGRGDRRPPWIALRQNEENDQRDETGRVVRLLLLAPPGAGKGTQGERLAAWSGARHIAAGDLLRAQALAGGRLGGEIAACQARGDLVPDQVVLDVLTPVVVEAAAAGGYILDGFPRTLPQATATAQLAVRLGVTLDAAIYLYAPAAVLTQRLLDRAR